jgi:benzodiazapine receptor
MRSLIMLIAFLLLAFVPAYLGVFFGPSEWYAQLIKPAFNPPDWIFGPVWTTLYVLMAVSLWLVWKAAPNKIEFVLPRNLFLCQLALNAAWSPLFFGLHNPGLALINLIFMWCFIIAMIYSFYRLSRPAAYLQIPYLLWVSFAGILNFIIFKLN